MKTLLGCAVIVALAWVPAHVSAQTPPLTCNAPVFHALDFWIGSWIVKNKSGVQVGRSRVEGNLNGCTVLERWTATNGGTGMSLSFYDRLTKKWTQHWISSIGIPTDYTGTAAGNSVVLTANAVDQTGQPVLNRITYTPLGDGRVRQFIEMSKDNGATWQPSFDGYYEPVKP